MKCPVCGKDTAYFYREDGIPEIPGKNIEVEMRCICRSEDGMIGELVATAEIDVILKRNSIIVYND